MKIKKNGATFIIFLCWLVYTVSYLGKLNYSANITHIIKFYDISKAEAGLVPTFFFFAYGIGQVVNGLLCKKYNSKWTIFVSLGISAIINFIIPFISNFAIVKWLWMINGFVLSMLWPTLVSLLAYALPQKDLERSSAIMGTTVALGTLMIYGLSSLFSVFNNFRLAFYIPGIAGIVVSIIWLISFNKALYESKEEKDGELQVSLKEEKTTKAESECWSRKIFMLSVCALCFCGVGVNLIKDGLTTWVPSILKEEYSMTDSISILLTLFLPIVAVFGNLYALSVHKRIPDYVSHCCVVFALMAVIIGVIIGCLEVKFAILMLVCLVIVNFLASSLNSLITSIYPIFMRGKVNSGFYAGILNGFCYLGSTISSYGLGYIADHFGWTAVFWFLIAVCIAVMIVCFVYKICSTTVKEKHFDRVS